LIFSRTVRSAPSMTVSAISTQFVNPPIKEVLGGKFRVSPSPPVEPDRKSWFLSVLLLPPLSFFFLGNPIPRRINLPSFFRSVEDTAPSPRRYLKSDCYLMPGGRIISSFKSVPPAAVDLPLPAAAFRTELWDGMRVSLILKRRQHQPVSCK